MRLQHESTYVSDPKTMDQFFHQDSKLWISVRLITLSGSILGSVTPSGSILTSVKLLICGSNIVLRSEGMDNF